MMPELLNNRPAWNLLVGVSIITIMEPNVSLRVALLRSQAAENSSDGTLADAIRLLEQALAETDSSGPPNIDDYDGKKVRPVLHDMLKDPPHSAISKHDPFRLVP